jgi:fructose-1,6-bisphosphatase/inositol monophosphatase family enzyme
LNGHKISCDASINKIQNSLILLDFGYDRSDKGVRAMAGACGRLLKGKTQAIRIVGSAVLALMWVACGRANAFVIGFHKEGGKPWDYCAGYVIATEAGAVFRQLDARTWANDVDTTDASKLPERPDGFDIYSQSCLCAGTTALANEIFDTVNSQPGSKSALI